MRAAAVAAAMPRVAPVGPAAVGPAAVAVAVGPEPRERRIRAAVAAVDLRPAARREERVVPGLLSFDTPKVYPIAMFVSGFIPVTRTAPLWR